MGNKSHKTAGADPPSGVEKRRVLLINPSLKPINLPSLPRYLSLSLLSVASGIVDRYDVAILDRALRRDDKELRRLLEDPAVACVGVSAMTGPALLDAAHCSRLVRQIRPDVAIVWGGWHVTMAPESVLREPFVDFIVQGEGENVFPQLLESLGRGEAEPAIPGVGYKCGEGLCISPPAAPLDLEQLPPAPLDLIPDIEPYIVHNWVPGGGRCLPIETGRGCPYGCSFCEISTYFGATCNAQSPERMVQEIVRLNQSFHVGAVRFYNPNFFLRLEDVRAFAQLLIDRDISILWAAEGAIAQFRSISVEDLRLFHRSGLRSVFFGVESGSDQIRAEVLNKRFTNQDCMTVAARFRETGIQFKFSLILGLPGETVEDSVETVDFGLDILARNPNSSLGGHMFLYAPMPGTPLTKAMEAEGYEAPVTLEEFARIDYATGAWMPWLTAKHARTVGVIATMSYFLSASKQDIPLTGFWRLLFRVLRAYYLFRLRKHLFMKTPDIMLLQRVLH